MEIGRIYCELLERAVNKYSFNGLWLEVKYCGLIKI